MLRVVLPQAIVEMLPSLCTLYIQLLKATAIVSLITVPELTYQAKSILIATFPVGPDTVDPADRAGDVPDPGGPDHHGHALGRRVAARRLGRRPVGSS